MMLDSIKKIKRRTQTMRKTISLFLVLILSITLLGGISLAEDTRETLTILIQDSSYIEDYETNAYTKHLEEVFGINLDFQLLPSSGAGDKLAMMINSGETLPDIILYDLNYNTTWKYAQTGAIIPLTKYYEDPEYNANFEACKEIVGYDYLQYILMPDGEYYSIPFFQREIHSEVNNKLWINQAWLKNLNLEMPKTTEEFYEVMKAFVNDDPNGNGIKDEYGIDASTNGRQGSILTWLMNAFIYDDYNDHFILTDGKVDVAYDKEAWKEGLLYIRKLVDEGIIDVDCFTRDRAQQKALAENEEINIVGSFMNSSISLLNNTTDRWQNFVGCEPLTGPEGVSFCSYNQSTAKNRWFITKDCKNPDLAFKIGAFIHDPTEEEFLLIRYGVEGLDWVRPETDKANYEGFKATHHTIRTIWNTYQNSHWQKNGPIFAWNSDQAGWDTGDPDDWNHRVPTIVVKYINHLPAEGEYVPTLIYTEDEIDEASEIQSNLKTYVKECETLFVTRQMSIEDDWDSYLQELENIGYKQFIAVSQQAYDRMYGK